MGQCRSSGSPVLDLTARLNRAVLRDPSLYELTADGTVSMERIDDFQDAIIGALALGVLFLVFGGGVEPFDSSLVGKDTFKLKHTEGRTRADSKSSA